MSRSRDRKCCYTRWSEPVLHRKYSTNLVLPSSDDESCSSIKRSGSSSPFIKKIQLSRTSHLEPETTGCCGCRSYCRRRKVTSKNRNSLRDDSSKKSSCDCNASQRIHESLEIKLVGNQLEESLAGEKLAALINHLEIATEILEAIFHHVNSLRISCSSVQRVIRLANELLMKPPRSSIVTVNDYYGSSLPHDLTTRICQAESFDEKKLRLLREIADSSSKNLTLSKQLNHLIEEHKVKKEDFNVAARNFKKLLEGSRLSVSQIDKLQRQYQAIMDDYRQNRRILETELPKIVETRLTAILQAFDMMAEFYNDNENSKQISDLLKIFSDILSRDNEAIDKRKYEKSQIIKLEICQKCKVNKVEKK